MTLGCGATATAATIQNSNFNATTMPKLLSTIHDSDYKFDIIITGDTDTLVPSNSQLNLLNNTSLDFSRVDGIPLTDEEIDNYELRIQAANSTEPGWVWDGFAIITSGPEDTVYTVKFGVWNKQTNAFVNDTSTSTPITAARTYSVTNSVTIEEAIDGRDVQYITYGQVRKYVDGTESFDADDTPGNDSGDNNRRVRTFDTINYTMAVRSESYLKNHYYEDGYVGFQFIIPYTQEELLFDTSSMGWMVSGETGDNAKFNYKIEEKDVTWNGQQVPGQVLTCYRHLNAAAMGTKTVFPITDLELSLALKVQKMSDGDIIDPTVYTWVDGNDVDLNNPSTSHVCDKDGTHKETANKGKELFEIPVEEIVVSAAPKYNVQLKQQTNELYVSKGTHSFDFSTGNDNALNKDAGTVNGLIASYGVTVQLYQDVPGKGLKGIEMPEGPITFDVTFDSRFDYTDPESGEQKSVTLSDQEKYRPLVWSYEGNKSSGGQTDDRKVSDLTSGYAVTIAPFNTHTTKAKAQPGTADYKTSVSKETTDCWYGGDWGASQAGNVATFTVSDYVINPNWFPNGDAGHTAATASIYYTPGKDPQTVDVACFSAGEVWVVYPVGEDAKELPTQYGNGVMSVTATDGNLQATSVSGQKPQPDPTGAKDNLNQKKLTDDVVQASLPLEVYTPGTYNHRMNYSGPTTDKSGHLYDWNGLYYTQGGCCYWTADDRSLAGQSGSIVAQVESREWRQESNYVYAANIMVKFDDKAFIPSGTASMGKTGGPAGTSYLSRKVVWVAKADGTGWASNQEMADAPINWDQFVYYDSLAALQADGKTAVAVVGEMRFKNPDEKVNVTWQSTSHTVSVFGKAAENLPEGYVAQSLMLDEYWTAADYESAKAAGYSAGTPGYELVVPSYTTTRDLPQPTGRMSTFAYRNAEYTDGVCTFQNTVDRHGDSLYIEQYKTKISKTTLQQNNDGKRKGMFDLDNNQTQVDYSLDWGMELYSDVLSGKKSTTVTITETIPAGTTYNNDIVLGGQFALDSPLGPAYKGSVTGGAKEGDTYLYKYTDSSGKEVEQEIRFASVTKSLDDKGNTVLTIVLENVPITNQGFPDFYYSVTIDKAAAKNAQQYNSGASIKSTEDQRKPYAAYGNYSEAGFSVSKNSALAIVKTIDKMFIDNGTQVTYSSTWENTAANDIGHALMMDTMPYNGDPRGSKYSGFYTLDGIKLLENNGTTDFSSLKFYYTTDDSVKNENASNWKDKISDIEGTTGGIWKPAEIATDGTVMVDNGSETKVPLKSGDAEAGKGSEVTAWCVIGDLQAGKMIQAKCSITPMKSEPNDSFTNQISMLDSAGTATAYIVSRQLSGLVWIDENKDGRRQSVESLVQDVKARLVTKEDFEKNGTDAKTVVNLFGDECEMITGSNGQYKFANLAHGVYMVLLTSGTDTGNIFEDYYATFKENVPNQETKAIRAFSLTDEFTKIPENVNSNAYGVYDKVTGLLIGGVIGGVEPDVIGWPAGEYDNGVDMPTVDKITASPYVVDNLDMGISPITDDLQVEKVWQDNDDSNRSGSITVQLMKSSNGANPEAVPGKTLELSANNGWKGSFDNLMQLEGGERVTYSVVETSVPNGYQVSYKQRTDDSGAVIGNDFIIINTQTTSVSGSKTWDDANNVDGKRPGSIIVNLLKTVNNANPVKLDSKQIVPDSEGEWASWSWDNLPMYDENGNAITYSVSENAISEYASTISDYNIINKHVPDKVSVPVTKSWNDGNNQDGIRPESVIIQLMKSVDGSTPVKVDGKTLVLSADSDPARNWKGTFVDLPKYENGKLISYSIIENQDDVITGIDATGTYSCDITGTVAGFIVTNTHTPEVISLSGSKIWNDANNQDGKRPDAITVQLYKEVGNNEPIAVDGKTKVISGTATGDDLKYAWDNLPKYENGEEISYSVKEIGETDGKIAGKNNTEYDVEYVTNTNNIKNSYIPEVVAFEGEKIWDDNNNQDGKRPDSVNIQLYKKVGDAEPVAVNGKIKTISGTATGDDLKYAWDNLPKYENGEEISYSVKEIGEINGKVGGKDNVKYDVIYQGNNVKNHYSPQDTTFSGKKIWNDANNQDGKRPDTITIQLYKKVGEAVPVEVSGKTHKISSVATDEELEYSWENLPKYENGVEIIYSVKEIGEINGKITGKDDVSYTVRYEDNNVKNDYVPATVDINGEKVWTDASERDGKRPSSIQVKLFASADGEDIDMPSSIVAEKTVINDGSDRWNYSWTGLPKYHNGKVITYTVREMNGQSSVEPNSKATFNNVEYTVTYSDGNNEIFNTHTPSMTSKTVAKIWDDNDNQDNVRPESIMVQLKANGVNCGEPVMLNETNKWIYTWDNLFVNDAGMKIDYTVEETIPVESQAYYTGNVDDDGEGDIFTITNVHKTEKKSVSGTKFWTDNNDNDRMRPREVTIALKKNGAEIMTTTASAGNGWCYSFVDLDRYENGKEIEYTVEEKDIPSGYISKVIGNDIENVHDTATVSRTVNKSWVGGGDHENDIVNVQLYADDVAYGAPVQLTSDIGWTYTWNGLQKYNAGKEIQYTVKETPIMGYKSTISYDDATSTFTVTNTSTAVQIAKVNAATGSLVPGAHLVLIHDNSTVADWVSEDTPKVLDNLGYNETYTLREISPAPGYEKTTDATIKINGEGEATISGELVGVCDGVLQLKNHELLNISGTKTWNLPNGYNDNKPAITIELMRNGELVDATPLVNDTYAFENLRKYDNEGVAYTYTVEEVANISPEAANDWKVEKNKYDFINTYIPEKTNINGTISWVDDRDRDGIRPTGTIIILVVDDKEIARTTVTEETDWKFNFDNLPVRDENGNKIDYRIATIDSRGYATEINGYDVVNTHVPEYVAISVNKFWDDNDDVDGMRPDALEMRIFANGEDTGRTLVLSADNDWSDTLTDLDKYKYGTVGEEIAWTVEEFADGKAITGYVGNTVVSKTESAVTMNVTNTHEPVKTSIRVEKKWVGDESASSRPNSIKVVLNGSDGTVVAGDVKAADEWVATFDDLPMNAGGMAIDWSVQECAVDGYECSVDEPVVADDGSVAVVLTNTLVKADDGGVLALLKTLTDASGSIASTGDKGVVFVLIPVFIIAMSVLIALSVQRRTRR